MYGVCKKAFRSLVFSNALTVMFDCDDDIDYTAVKAFLDGDLKDRLDICDQLTFHIQTNTLVLRGCRISNTVYITSKESDSYYSFPSPLKEKDMYTLFFYLYHMHATV
jgi:hypothetical protein